ncbi:MAG: hypothetical protein WC291_11615 [Thermodesulfovibrionales bacterium]|jgi:hypothetical protein
MEQKIRFDVRFRLEGKDEDGNNRRVESKIAADDFEAAYAWAKNQIGRTLEGVEEGGVALEILEIERMGRIAIV